MDKRIIIVSLVVATMVFSSFPTIVKSEKAPDFPSTNNGPWTGWEDEQIYFSCSAQGGTPPYQYRWEFGDGTSTSWSLNNYASHAYTSLASSPTTYSVKSRIMDSQGKTSWCQKVATVYKDYDLAANVQWESGIWREGVSIDIHCKVTCEYNVAPGFDWYARCEIRTYPGDELVRRFNPHAGVTLYDTEYTLWDETWDSPTSGMYRAFLYIYATHDNISSNDMDYDGVIIWPN